MPPWERVVHGFGVTARIMPELTPLYDLLGWVLPFECMEMTFMRQALLGLLLLAPMTAIMGVQVVNFRMAFFADAISHSAFSGVAIGLILGIHPNWTMPLFGLLVGLGIMASQRRSSLSSDTVIGVFFSGVVAFGLAMVSRDRNSARNIHAFLYGDILSISTVDLYAMVALFLFILGFQLFGFNRLLYIGLNPSLAQVHRVRVVAYQTIYASLLSLVVILSVRAVGVLLVTAMLIVPAATARNISSSAGAMIWWTLAVSIISSVAGLIISAQDWARTATGATIILIAFLWFLVSLGASGLKGRS